MTDRRDRAREGRPSLIPVHLSIDMMVVYVPADPSLPRVPFSFDSLSQVLAVGDRLGLDLDAYNHLLPNGPHVLKGYLNVRLDTPPISPPSSQIPRRTT